ncbi:MAG: type II toxin-antitoxin system ParD family antitoxin [Methylobacter sp.]
MAALRSALIEGEEIGITGNYSLTGLIEELDKEYSV